MPNRFQGGIKAFEDEPGKGGSSVRGKAQLREGFICSVFPKCWRNLQEVWSGCSLSCLEMFMGLISTDNKPDKEQFDWSLIFLYFFTESQDHYGWKRPLRPPSPTFAQALPSPLNQSTKSIFTMYFYTALGSTFRANISESGFHVLLKMRVFIPFYLNI